MNDCHEYAVLGGAKEGYRVQWEGDELSARAQELFFSLHMDENHADCILRACTVNILNTPDEPAPPCWDEIEGDRHKFIAWRAYNMDDKKVHGLTNLPSKKLREACELELKRGPKGMLQRAKEAARRRAPVVSEPEGPLEPDELQAIWLPRKHLEVWLENPATFGRIAVGIHGGGANLSSCVNVKESML